MKFDPKMVTTHRFFHHFHSPLDSASTPDLRVEGPIVQPTQIPGMLQTWRGILDLLWIDMRGSINGENVWFINIFLRGNCQAIYIYIYILVGGFNPSEEYESQLGRLFPMYGKTINVPSHQPDGGFHQLGK